RQIRSQVTAAIAIRILLAIALADLGNAAKVAELYKVDESTVRRYFRLYQEGGIDCLLEIHYLERQSYLTDGNF
ncbi:MAG: helix-turn-helix domain-containing protein, partial [Planctomycetaceae bacterium]|nr:helix-turn-helix domain-containing protein [Planctomycetaceae bacterium]